VSLHLPVWLQNDTYIASLDRSLVDAVYAGGGGIVAPGDLIVTQRGAGANMSVDVAAGKAVVTGTDVAGQGKYLCWSDAVANVVIAAAPGTGLSRIDRIVATVRDADAIGGLNNDWILQRIAGTAGSTPSPPAVPASSLAIARVLVGANVTSILTANVTDDRVAAGLGAAFPWTPYVPTWTAATTNPTIGNGSIVARYRQAGKSVHFRLSITGGSTTNGGSGSYTFGLPVVAFNDVTQDVICRMVAGGTQYTGFADIAPNTATCVGIVTPGNGVMGVIDNTLMAAGTVIVVQGTYEAA
jgi:hypothetical protein